jgi:hypothetical protein
MLVLIPIPEPMRTLQDLFNNVTSYNLPPALLLENPTAEKDVKFCSVISGTPGREAGP